jgi:hypothetical protein
MQRLSILSIYTRGAKRLGEMQKLKEEMRRPKEEGKEKKKNEEKPTKGFHDAWQEGRGGDCSGAR